MFRYEDFIGVGPWWNLFLAVENLKKNHKKTIEDSIWKVLGWYMPDYCPHTPKTSKLPKIFFLENKPDPLIMRLNYICCSVTLIILCIDIKRGNFNEVTLCCSDFNNMI